MKAMVAKAVRQILFVVGGALGSKGAVSESNVEIITAAVMVVISLAWSWFNEWRERKEAVKVAATVGLLMLCFGVVGCASVAPGSDPVVVYAERATLMSMDTIDAFLKLERANEAQFGEAVHGVAEILRREAPRAIRSARNATKTYKLNRNAENKATLETALAVLKALADDALAASPRPLTGGGVPLGAPMFAIVPAGILVALQGIAALLELLAKERERLQQAGELSAEQDEEIDAEVEAVLLGEHWQPGRGLKDGGQG